MSHKETSKATHSTLSSSVHSSPGGISAALPRDFLGHKGDGKCTLTPPAKLTCECSLDEIFVSARNSQASDVHLSVGNPIIFRKFGSLTVQSEDKFSEKALHALIEKSFKPDVTTEFFRSGDCEFVQVIPGAGRFRVTLAKQRAGYDVTARLIPTSIRGFADSGMPASCKELTKWSQGLILITGPAGCGKTSTLTTLVDIINQEQNAHIITIENPIETIYTPDKCQITQREVNTHTLTQAAALRAALREDPNILVVSELRDLDSVKLAVTASETGHLVFGTMNANDATQTISTLLDSFPPDEQPIVASMISESLRGVICQKLMTTTDGTGVVPIYEILIVTPAVSHLIRENKITNLQNQIAMGKSQGMVLFEHSIQELAAKGITLSEV